MKIPISLAVSLAFFGSLAACPLRAADSVPPGSQQPQLFEKEIKLTAHVGYLLYLPEAYAKSKERWPLMLFLHGAGERGDDLEKIKAHGPAKLVAKEGKQFPFVIVSPQCPQNDFWTSKLQIASLSALLDEIVTHYQIDPDRIYVTGLSMGGFGSWKLAVEYPNRFAAIAPICGKGDPSKAEKIKHLPIWVFHGAKDPTVPISGSQEMVDALKKCGADPKFTIYPEAGHDSWTESYNNPALYEWLLKQKRSGK